MSCEVTFRPPPPDRRPVFDLIDRVLFEVYAYFPKNVHRYQSAGESTQELAPFGKRGAGSVERIRTTIEEFSVKVEMWSLRASIDAGQRSVGMKVRFGFLALLLAAGLLLSGGLAKADTLQVTFDTSFPFNTIPIEMVSGSFLWNVGAQTISNISISSSGSYSFLPVLDFSEFAPPGNLEGFPVGSILILNFRGSNGGPDFQFDYLEHGGLDIPPSGPGTYAGDFFLVGGGLAVTPAMTGEVIVTEAVSTPEPQAFWLLALGATGLLIAVARRKFLDCTRIVARAGFASL